MNELKDIKSIYFIGIGGIGMSALARYFQSRGAKVMGYDRSPTSLTKELEDSGIPVHYNEDVTIIPKDVDVVVYTPAVPENHKELEYYRANNYTVIKRSDILQLITKHSFNICVAGTHGKTTITTMIAHILRHSGYGCNAFLGGISVNYGTNFWSSERDVVVVEADEYDRSFLKLIPDVAVITAMDADHLDIYGTPEELEQTFIRFSRQIKKNGCLVSKYGLKKDNEITARTHFRYSFNNIKADIYAADVHVSNEAYEFDVISDEWILKDVRLNMGGLHNIENSIAAITVAKYIGIDDEKIKAAVNDFRGVKRRFEHILSSAKDRFGNVLIDDYAHHPEELKALISGIRSIYPNRKCTIVFQPHLFSRTQDFAKEFAESLDEADEVILLPIYPARELPIEGVSSELIGKYMKKADVNIMTKEAMQEWVKVNKPSLLVMAGAGDIDALVSNVKRLLSNENRQEN